MSNSDFALAESVSTTNATLFICIYILILVYCCFGLAIVCDAYFVPALQKLSYTYDLPPDIAGSTLMALGASVPELFASLIGVFVTEDDIGTGSIIGSSCFNLIAVPAACAFVASATFTRKLIISPVPVMRNSAFYAITILVLLLIIKDNKVDIPEAIILLLFFVMYMSYMIACARSRKLSDSNNNQKSSLTSSYVSTDSAIAECNARDRGASGKQSFLDHQLDNTTTTNQQQQQHQQQHQHSNNPLQQQQQQQQQQQPIYGRYYWINATQGGGLGGRGGNGNGNGYAGMGNDFVNNNYLDERSPLMTSNKSCEIPIIHRHQQQSNHLYYPKVDCMFVSEPNLLDSVSVDLGIAIKNSSCLVKNVDELNHEDKFGADENSWLSSRWILWPMFPLTLSMKVLSPMKFKTTFTTIWTFIVSISLIGALTYVSVWMVHLFGQSMGIPETVAGMTILSWGTGIPELIASIVLIKKTAQADMAICNTIGSNVIDASFCLSLPWLIKCILNQMAGEGAVVEIQSAALPWTSFTLFLSVVLLILILKLHNWELSCSVGVWLTITYATFVVVATYLESSFSETGLDLLAMI